MLYVVSCHLLRFGYYFTNKYFVFSCKFALTGVAKVKTEPVGFREMSAPSRIMNLRNILYPKPPAQEGWSEGTRQIYQRKIAVTIVEYVGKVEVSMAIICLVKFLYKACQLRDKLSSQSQVFNGSRAVETTG